MDKERHLRIRSKAEAQQRVDQIEAFCTELSLLEQDGVVTLEAAQRAAVSGYHSHLLQRLAAAFDIDATAKEKQLSLGMRIVSTLGTLALAASLFFFYIQFWGGMPTATQVTILVALPAAGLLCTLIAVMVDRSGTLARLFAMVTWVGFVLNLVLLGRMYNCTPSLLVFAIWAVFALMLAYATGSRLLLAMGVLSAAAFLSAQAATWSGCYWISFGERPEHFLPAALLLLLLSLLPHRPFPGFAALYRIFALLFFFLPVLVLSNWGGTSYLAWPIEQIEAMYQLVGFIASGLMIALGIVAGWPEVVNTGNVFFTLFLYTKFYDWWWEWMPKYQFFLIVGLTALVMLAVLKVMRLTTVKQQLRRATCD